VILTSTHEQEDFADLIDAAPAAGFVPKPELSAAAIARAVALADLEALTGRGTERVLRVARTIADVRHAASVEAADLDEAARFRTPARAFVVGEVG
jgi:hypothetical protein